MFGTVYCVCCRARVQKLTSLDTHRVIISCLHSLSPFCELMLYGSSAQGRAPDLSHVRRRLALVLFYSHYQQHHLTSY